MKGVSRLLHGWMCALVLMPLASCPLAQASTTDSPAINASVVDNGTGVIRRLLLIPYISGYSGEAMPADIQQAAQIPDAEYVPLERKTPYLAARKQWFRFFIHNDSRVARSFVLNLDQTLLSEVALQASVQGVAVKQVLTGQGYPYASRDLDYDFFAFQLDVPAGETMKVDFSVKTDFAAIFIPSLVSTDKFVQQVTFDGRFAGAVMGMLYSIVFFLFIYVLYIRKLGAEFAMWVFAALSMLSAMYMAGIFQRLIPDEYGQWRNIVFLLIHGPLGIAFMFLLCGYYQTAGKYPWMHRSCLFFGTINGFCTVVAPFCVLTVPWVSFSFLTQLLMASNTLLMLIGFVFSIQMLVARREEKKLFSVGIILFVVMVILSTLFALGVPMPYVLGRYGYEFGLTLEVDFLAVAIVVRIVEFEREKLTTELRMLKLNAEMQARSEFVDRVTHDVKSPLSAVVGAVHLLREPVSPEQRASYLDVIQQSCNTVINIVDGILSYSRFRSGHVVLHKQPFSMIELLTELENAIRVTYRQKNVAFSVSVNDALPPLVVGDRNRLQQLLNNLLTNAFKFTDEGSVGLLVSVIAQGIDKVTLRFDVRDTGIGMSPEFVSRAFEPYAREESHTGYRQGFGLGLPICRQLVELMGGTIGISSVPGRGSCFTVTLPFDLPQLPS